jgi:hypothetical protein
VQSGGFFSIWAVRLQSPRRSVPSKYAASSILVPSIYFTIPGANRDSWSCARRCTNTPTKFARSTAATREPYSRRLESTYHSARRSLLRPDPALMNFID